MKFEQLIGAGYLPLSRKAECQKAINVYRERVESDEGIGTFTLYRSPGLAPVLQPDASKRCCRGSFELNGVLVMAIDDMVYFITAGYVIDETYGPIADNGKPVVMAYSRTTLMIVSAGVLYRINLGILTAPVTTFTVCDIAFIDNYFVALADNPPAIPGATHSSFQFYFSDDDGATWPAGNVQTAEASANAFMSLIVHQQALYMYGTKISQVFLVGTNANAPFVPQQSAVIPFGTAAPRSLAQIGLYRYWLESDKDGCCMVYRAQAYSSERISDHALENALRAYDKTCSINDAIGMTYKLNGHEFYRITFPMADATWELNITVMMATGKPEWVQIGWWDFQHGQYHRHRANTIVAAFSRIVVGDFENGWIYEMAPENYTDYGFPLRWERQCPHILEENKQVIYDRIEIGAETGVGLESPLYLNNYSMDQATFAAALATQVGLATVTAAQALVLQAIYDGLPYVPLNPYPDPVVMTGLGFFSWGTDPTIRLQYSDDGAKSFNQELARSLGRAGEDVQVAWDRLGAGRDRVFHIAGDDPCKLALTTAWLDAQALSS